MEQFIHEIQSFCQKESMTPQRLLRASVGAGWGQWEKWRAGETSPTMATVDRIRSYMLEYRGRDEAA